MFADVFLVFPSIVTYHDKCTELPSLNRYSRPAPLEKLLTLTSVGTRRTRPICLARLSGAKGIPTNVRNLRKVPQANRAVSSRLLQTAESIDFRQREQIAGVIVGLEVLQLIRNCKATKTLPITLSDVLRQAPFYG
jgi:hypothetical protein